MNKKENGIWKQIVKMYRMLDVSRGKDTYALILIHITSLIIFLKEIISYFVMPQSEITERSYFLITGGLMFVIFLMTFLVYTDKLGIRDKFTQLFIKIYPYVFATIGILILFIYKDYEDRIFIYIFIIIILSFIQIYNKIKRIFLFLYALILFVATNYLLEGFSSNVSLYFFISIIITLMGFIIATIYNTSYTSEIKAINVLHKKNQEQLETIGKLTKLNEELNISQTITTRMLEITGEILENENVDDVLQLILDEAIKLIQKAQAGSIILERDNKIVFVAAHGYNLETLQNIGLEFNDLFQSTLENKYEATIIQDVEVFDAIHLSSEKMDHFREKKVHMSQACLTCSFQYNNKFFGSINLDNFDSKDIFKEADKSMLQKLAKEIEIVISIHKLYEKAIRPTKIDDLTQAFTRKYGIALFESMIKKNKKKQYAVCFLDINSLKSINDELGHDAGDKYLSFFGQAVKKTKLKENIFSRMGGDEFLLILNNLDEEDVQKEMEVLKEYLKNNKIVLGDKSYQIKFAAGISIYPKDSIDIYELIKISDQRMYENKREQYEN